MVGQGSRQSTPNWIELLPEALVVTAQVAQESWSLLLPILVAFPANGGGETPCQYSDTLRIMPHCISELRSHAPTFLIKIRLVMPHAPRGPATTDMLAAGGSCCINQDPAQLCKSCSRVPSAEHTFTLSKGCARSTEVGNIIFLSGPIPMQLGERETRGPNRDISCGCRCREV